MGGRGEKCAPGTERSPTPGQRRQVSVDEFPKARLRDGIHRALRRPGSLGSRMSRRGGEGVGLAGVSREAGEGRVAPPATGGVASDLPRAGLVRPGVDHGECGFVMRKTTVKRIAFSEEPAYLQCCKNVAFT